MEPDAVVGRNVRKIRLRKGLTQGVLAKVMETSRPSVSQVERGRRRLTLVEAILLSKKLGFGLHEVSAGLFKDCKRRVGVR